MAIQLQNISKSFGPVQALKDVNAVFEENRIYGLLGRNGAGKSTLLNILTNRIFPDKGAVLVDGENARENDRAQSKIFLMSEAVLHPEAMRVSGALGWAQSFYPGFDPSPMCCWMSLCWAWTPTIGSFSISVCWKNMRSPPLLWCSPPISLRRWQTWWRMW